MSTQGRLFIYGKTCAACGTTKKYRSNGKCVGCAMMGVGTIASRYPQPNLSRAMRGVLTLARTGEASERRSKYLDDLIRAKVGLKVEATPPTLCLGDQVRAKAEAEGRIGAKVEDMRGKQTDEMFIEKWADRRKPKEKKKPTGAVEAFVGALLLVVDHHDENGFPIGLALDAIRDRTRKQFPRIPTPGPHFGRPCTIAIATVTAIASNMKLRGVKTPYRPRGDRWRDRKNEPKKPIRGSVRGMMRSDESKDSLKLSTSSQANDNHDHTSQVTEAA